jgi:hypothetical protein
MFMLPAQGYLEGLPSFSDWAVDRRFLQLFKLHGTVNDIPTSQVSSFPGLSMHVA